MKMDLSTILGIAGGLLTLASVYFATLEARRDKELENVKQRKRDSEARAEKEKDMNEIRERDAKIIEQATEIIRLSQSLSSSQSETISLITGGDSWAYLRPGTWGGKEVFNDKFGAMLVHNGKHPLYDVTVSIDLVEKQDAKSSTTTNLTRIFYGTLNPSLNPEMVAMITLPRKDHIDYSIEIRTRNGVINQQWHLYKKSHLRFAWATKVIRQKYDDTLNAYRMENLFTHIDSGLSEAEINWLPLIRDVK